MQAKNSAATEDPGAREQFTAGFLRDGIVQGIAYQQKLLTWVAWKIVSKKNASKWWLGSEVFEARGFHDLVLKYVDNAVDADKKASEKKYLYRFVQIKYTMRMAIKISIHSLLSREFMHRQYSLLFLFRSYINMIDKFEKITPEQIVDVMVFTNKDIDTSLEFLEPVEKDEIFGFEEKGQRYRFNLDKLRKPKWYPIINWLRTITRDENHIWGFLSKLVFAVSQPSVVEMDEFIINNMGRVFHTPQIFYNNMFRDICEWFSIVENRSSPYLTDEHIKKQLKKTEDWLLAEKEMKTSYIDDSSSLSDLLTVCTLT